MKILMPVILLIAGLIIGTGGAYFLRPEHAVTAQDHESDAHGEADDHAEEQSHSAPPKKSSGHGDSHDDNFSGEEDYYEMQNQFVVPVIHQGSMKALVLMGLAIEADVSLRPAIARKEPKLRDAFLRVMFDHASIGGFDGNFLQNGPMNLLEENLLARAHDIIGEGIRDILLLEVGRQELIPDS